MSSLTAAIEAIKNGAFVLVQDEAGRENEADLVLAAEHANKEKIAFMIRHSSGILCVPMLAQRLNQLELPQMVQSNQDLHRTAFTVSTDALEGTTTGISSSDRAKTIQALIDPKTTPKDLRRPGHIFPLKYAEGGVLKRAGHTEASIDLIKLAGLYPASVIAEVMNDDGTLARGEDLQAFAKTHKIPLITVEEVIRYRRMHEKLVFLESSARIPTDYGMFTAYVYRSLLDGVEHVALVKGEPRGKKDVLVRVHSECLTGDTFFSKRCDCGWQLSNAMKLIEQKGEGVIVYLRGHEGRGIGLAHKLRAYGLQDLGRDTVEANLELGFPVDTRDYGIGAQILADLGLTCISLITNNPAKYSCIRGYDLEINERVSIPSPTTDENRHYLETKKLKMGHF